jgi:hypothetical protein
LRNSFGIWDASLQQEKRTLYSYKSVALVVTAAEQKQNVIPKRFLRLSIAYPYEAEVTLHDFGW